MKCPICGQETAGQDVQRWGPEFAHARCVMAYSLGGADARMEIRERIERLHSIEAAARKTVAAFEALGNAKQAGALLMERGNCETAMIALKNALFNTTNEPPEGSASIQELG